MVDNDWLPYLGPAHLWLGKEQGWVDIDMCFGRSKC